MKERQQQTIQEAKIVWPALGLIEIDPKKVDFVYIMRKDAAFAISPVAEKMATRFGADTVIFKQVLVEEYDSLFAKTVSTLADAFSAKGTCEIHIFDPDVLEQSIRKIADNNLLISLDPLLSKEVFTLPVSRGYFLGGKKDFGQITRPGNNSSQNTAEAIATTLRGQEVCVAEDDVFSGSSLIAGLNLLLQSGIKILKVIPGIQVGKPEALESMGVLVEPVVTYKMTDSSDIFQYVDLGDPRDYVVGISGLVVRLPNGEYGRAPYILPFVSPTARAGIPKEKEALFSMKMLEANYTFFQNIATTTHQEVLLCDMDDAFITMMCEMYGFAHQTSMTEVIKWATNNFSFIWQTTHQLGIQQQEESL